MSPGSREHQLWVSPYSCVRGIAPVLSPSDHNGSRGSRTQFSADGPRQGTYNLRSPAHFFALGSAPTARPS